MVTDINKNIMLMKTAICAIIKDEHLYLQEWIEWHLNIGFDAIHLFEDKGSKSHQEIIDKYENVYLRRYKDDEEVQEILSEQGDSHRQQVLYDWFAIHYKGIYDWAAFIDLDEFVNFAPNYDLQTLCEEFKPYPCVLLNWRMMGASGHIERPRCGVVEAYTGECDFLSTDKGWKYKSFVNLNRYEGMKNLHLGNGYVNTLHHSDINELCYIKAWINHYFTKSWEDWCDRIFKRGGTLVGHRNLCQFFECNKDMEILRRCIEESVIDKQAIGHFYLDWERNIISGGNTSVINRLNGENNYDFNKDLATIVDDFKVITIGKCGCSTIKSIALFINKGYWETDYKKVHSIVNNHDFKFVRKVNYKKDKVIAIWRDPFERLISLYKNTLSDDQEGNYFQGLGKNPTVEDFIYYITKELQKPVFKQNTHIRKQCTFYDLNRVNQIVKISDLDDWIECNKLPLPPCHINNEEKRIFPISDFEKFREYIGILYREDYNIIIEFKDKVWKK